MTPEAEVIAGRLLCEVAFEAVAGEVEAALRAVDLHGLNNRAGEYEFGNYTDPVEAAWELLDEAIESYRDEMKRYLRLGMTAEAEAMCQGLLLGLYGIRDEEKHNVIAWAPDFAEDAASSLIELYSRGCPMRLSTNGCPIGQG